jgi:biotin carboxylase
MAHLLVIESWVGPSSISLPVAIRNLGHRFTFVTRNPEHYRASSPVDGPHPLLEADRILVTETNDLPKLLGVVAEANATNPIDGVLTSCDYYLETVAEVARSLGLPGPSPMGVRTARTKDLAREAMDRAGLPGPEFRSVDTREAAHAAAEEIGYPLVLKPVDLCAGMYVRLVRDESELEDGVRALDSVPNNARQQPRRARYLLEEYMTGEEVSVETATDHGQTSVIGITDKALGGFPAFIEVGHMFPAYLEPQVALVTQDLVQRALAAVGFDHGVAHTEVKLTPGGPRIVEINARLGGNYIPDLVRMVTRVDIPQVMVELALGHHPDLTPRTTGVRSAAVRFLLTPEPGQLMRVHGIEALVNDPSVVDWEVKARPGQVVRRPMDNSDYLGRVMVIDREGQNARQRAEIAAARVQLEVAQAARV